MRKEKEANLKCNFQRSRLQLG